MSRTESIAVSDSEKELLSEAAEDIFGTREVPFGATISALVERYDSGAQSGN